MTDPTNGFSTSPHPASSAPDPTLNAAQAGQPSAAATPPAELSRLKVRLTKSLKHFPDFPTPGILFEDIFPLFADPNLLVDLIRALELFVLQSFPNTKIDTVVGLDARGFLIGPSLALKLGAGFAPVRKKGKLPGPTVRATYTKEYGTDEFEMQEGAIKGDANVLILDDIIATGGSAAAAGELVRKLGGKALGYVFLDELQDLKGRDKLDAPVHTLFLRAMDITKMTQEATHEVSKPRKEY